MENRLVSVTKGTHRSEFEYDPLGRRSRILEKDADGQGGWTTGSDKRYLWEGAEIVEEEAADGSTLKAFYGQGFVDTDGTALFYTRDHLGSVRELVDAQGAVRARYDYDPYGRVTKLSGDRDSAAGFTGHVWHAQSGLFLTLFRAYDPVLGRWISRDPIEEEGGTNIYQYCFSNPIGLQDPLGLEVKIQYVPAAHTVVVRDLDTGQEVRAFAYSGHLGNNDKRSYADKARQRDEGPIPEGDYEVLDFPNPGSVPDYYWLEAMDGTRDDKDSKTGRTNFRFHLGTGSNGCITVPDDSKKKTKYGQDNPYYKYFDYSNKERWNQIKDMLSRTKKTTVYDSAGRPRIRYGTVHVY